MKTTLICLLLGFAFSYNREGAVEYAKKYCNNYNPNYNNYKYYNDGDESANFISQCISIGGGQDLRGCDYLDNKGMVKYDTLFGYCLTTKGWKKTLNASKGDVLILRTNLFPMIVTDVVNNNIYFCSHKPDRCDALASVHQIDIYSPS